MMLPWLFSVSKDALVKEVKARILERVEMLQSGEYWSLSMLMYADDAAVLLAS